MALLYRIDSELVDTENLEIALEDLTAEQEAHVNLLLEKLKKAMTEDGDFSSIDGDNILDAIGKYFKSNYSQIETFKKAAAVTLNCEHTYASCKRSPYNEELVTLELKVNEFTFKSGSWSLYSNSAREFELILLGLYIPEA